MSPRYIRPFKILERMGKVTYRLVLLPVHNVCYVSILRQYIRGATYVIDFNDTEVNDNVTYQERLI